MQVSLFFSSAYKVLIVFYSFFKGVFNGNPIIKHRNENLWIPYHSPGFQSNLLSGNTSKVVKSSQESEWKANIVDQREHLKESREEVVSI